MLWPHTKTSFALDRQQALQLSLSTKTEILNNIIIRILNIQNPWNLGFSSFVCGTIALPVEDEFTSITTYDCLTQLQAQRPIKIL